MGFLLFLLVLGLLHDRLVPHPLPPAPLAPTLWIGLGPVAVAVLAPLALARAGQDTFAVLLYLTLVGFWSVVTARTLTATRTGRIWQR